MDSGQCCFTFMEMAPLISNKARGTLAQSISIIYLQCTGSHCAKHCRMFPPPPHPLTPSTQIHGSWWYEGKDCSAVKLKGGCINQFHPHYKFHFGTQDRLILSSNHTNAPNEMNLWEKHSQFTAFVSESSECSSGDNIYPLGNKSISDMFFNLQCVHAEHRSNFNWLRLEVWIY